MAKHSTQFQMYLIFKSIIKNITFAFWLHVERLDVLIFVRLIRSTTTERVKPFLPSPDLDTCETCSLLELLSFINVSVGVLHLRPSRLASRWASRHFPRHHHRENLL